MKAIVLSAFTLIAAMTIGLLGISRPLPAAALDIAQTSAYTASALVRSTDDPSTVLGEAMFTETPEGLTVDVALNGVPAGFHGFHVHEFGSCDEGGNGAGGHFNPLAVKHGFLVTDGYDNAHVGDLGNIFIYADGSGALTVTVPDLSLTEGERAIATHAVILHSDRDDFGQPTGNAGGRIGCGIIELAD